MNLFWREMKAYRFGLLWWGLGMVALVASGIAKFTAYSRSGQSISGLLNQFPESVKILFGMTGFDIDRVSGYYGVLFAYIALMAAIHAVLLGAGIISKEERDRTSEFLFVKPISRGRVITAKLLAGLVNLVALNLITLASSLYFVHSLTGDDSFTSFILVSMVGMFGLQLLFFGVGTMVAAISSRPKAAGSLATTVLLLCYILLFFINLNGHVEYLKYLTPFAYFDARDMLASGGLNPLFVGLSLVLIALMVVGTYRAYARRDLTI